MPPGGAFTLIKVGLLLARMGAMFDEFFYPTQQIGPLESQVFHRPDPDVLGKKAGGMRR